jgi:hypothetical protein
MDELAKLVDNASATPIRGKRMPRIANMERSKKSDNIKETALAIIEDTFRNTTEKTQKILQKVNRASVPVKAVYEAFQQFEKALGGRDALISTLQHCPESSTGVGLVNKLLQDPDFLEYASAAGQDDNVRYSLAAICGRHRIPFNAIVAAFKDAKTAEIAVKSLTALSTSTPVVMEQMAQNAQNTYHTCHLCEGSGRIWTINSEGEWAIDEKGDHRTQICHNCRGQGRVFKDHDVQNRKMFLQTVGLAEDKRAPLVGLTINQQANIFKGSFLPGDNSFEQLIKAVDALSAKEPILDAEIVSSVPNTIYEKPE